MGLLDTLRSWLEVGGTADSETDTPPDDTADDEPTLDPSGATETRVKTTDTAVDALKETRNEADRAEGDESKDR
jgi:hypothetical protein